MDDFIAISDAGGIHLRSHAFGTVRLVVHAIAMSRTGAFGRRKSGIQRRNNKLNRQMAEKSSSDNCDAVDSKRMSASVAITMSLAISWRMSSLGIVSSKSRTMWTSSDQHREGRLAPVVSYFVRQLLQTSPTTRSPRALDRIQATHPDSS
jgi:hypothetical protein